MAAAAAAAVSAVSGDSGCYDMMLQGFPNAVNESRFPSVLVKPGEKYVHEVRALCWHSFDLSAAAAAAAADAMCRSLAIGAACMTQALLLLCEQMLLHCSLVHECFIDVKI